LQSDVIAPGAIIGILGGGQLGRMTALAAAALGYRTHTYSPDRDAPAAEIATTATRAAYDDAEALARFAAAIDVATFEFENVPHATVRVLEERVPVRPGWKALRIAQDRVLEKQFVNDQRIGTAPWAEVTSMETLRAALDKIGRPAVLKTARLGYDGKGQARIGPDDDAAAAWRAVGEVRSVLEGLVDFTCEISVVVARGLDGATATYVPVENRHIAGILDTTIAPARIARAVIEAAEDIAVRLARALDIVGLLAVEMFVTRSGDVLVNEMAPRAHNSGHWTIDGCVTSQFEQHVRAICGLPLGSPERHSDAMMKNLIGDGWKNWPELVRDPAAKLHLYGKTETRPGRKMGHVTRLYPKS
jgi:5-(carboxyamino)imidazole ribonucleotide synthase